MPGYTQAEQEQYEFDEFLWLTDEQEAFERAYVHGEGQGMLNVMAMQEDLLKAKGEAVSQRTREYWR